MQLFKQMMAALLLAFAFTGAVAAADRVDINTANAQQLADVLVNVGPTKAEAIVAYRQANGPFRSPEQLALVRGIGVKTVENNRDRIIVGGARPAARATPRATPAAPQRVVRR